MISRDNAALVRYAILVLKRPSAHVAAEQDITVSMLERIVEGALVPVADERVVVQPNFVPRARKLSMEQKSEAAHLICFGATLQGLANRYDVNVRAIQNIKDGFTARVGDSTANAQPTKPGLNHNNVAECRYQHEVMKEAIALLAAGLMLNYKAVYRAVVGKTFRPTHKRKLTLEGKALDFESPTGRAVKLYIYGADVGFISDVTDIDQGTVQALVDALTEVR